MTPNECFDLGMAAAREAQDITVPPTTLVERLVIFLAGSLVVAFMIASAFAFLYSFWIALVLYLVAFAILATTLTWGIGISKRQEAEVMARREKVIEEFRQRLS